MNATELTQVRQDLENALASIHERREKLAKHVHRREEPIPQDFSEQATALENDETMVALEDELSAKESAINRALSRIDDGTYGVCEYCGSDIAKERLRVLPESTLCVHCAVDEKA